MTETLLLDARDAVLLDAWQMATFACEGIVRLDGVVPPALNTAVLAELGTCQVGDALSYWRSSSAMKEVFRLPRVAGALRSLMGPAPVYNHSFLHIVPAHHSDSQDWHADSVIDTRPAVFDVLVLYYPHETPREMGPTLVLPGSHLRKIRFGSIAHLRNVIGQQSLACPAGTIAVVHADIWHCAQPNLTDRDRYMFKMRLQLSPGQDQRGYFNTEGYNDPEVLARIFRYNPAWFGAEHREEQIQRAKFWRYLTGDDGVDATGGMLTLLTSVVRSRGAAEG